MLHLVAGCKVKSAQKLCEQYEVMENCLFANVNADKIDSVLRHFIRIQNEKLFFSLELPSSVYTKREEPKGDTTFYRDVYYLDGLDKEKALQLLDQYGNLLIQDGISQFGFGVKKNSTELVKRPYNIMLLYSTAIQEHLGFFEAHGIRRADRCVTAWDTFSAKQPGDCFAVAENGITVYDLPKKLEGAGIYFAERREDTPGNQ